MCGITGVYGAYAPLKAVLMTLNQLERGVQGCGVAYMCKDSLKVVKAPVHPAKFFRDWFNELAVDVHVAIGHNRLPSQGRVCYVNTHPFVSCDGYFAMAHNGHAFLADVKAWLLNEGHRFMGDTDSEVLAHVLEELLKERGDMFQALRELVLNYLSGTVAVLTCDGELYFAKSGANPLHYALADGEVYVASTCKAIKEMAKLYGVKDYDVVEVGDGEVLRVKDGLVDHLEIVKPKRQRLNQFFDSWIIDF